MIRAYFTIAASAFALAGCSTTTSFAPPPLNVQYSEGGAAATCPSGRTTTTVQVERNVAGAYQLVDAFIAAYRCSAHSVANGRQAFQIPAFLATTGAAAVSALGGGATFGILGTGANAMFNAGNNYWDPRLKAAIYDHALDALLCIKTEAVDIPAYKFDDAAAESPDKGNGSRPVAGGGTVTVSADKQYFEMVSAASFSVERILSQRLSNMAPVDASAVAAELTRAAEEARAKEEARLKAQGGTTGSGSSTPQGGGNGTVAMSEQQDLSARDLIHLDLDVLKPKLDECVIRAKL